jgi:hypothetical protein
MFAIPLGLIGALLGLNSYNSGISTAACGGGGCHGTTSTNTILNLTSVPSLTTGYQPNTIYKCTLAVVNPTATLTHNGFTCIASAGSMTVPSGATNMSASGATIGHNSKAPMVAGTGIWIFDWNSPSTATSPVTFNIGGNAVNNNGMSSGDQWANQVFTFQPPTGNSAPTVSGVNVSGITQTNATITGSVNANGASTSSFVQYGLTNAYGTDVNTTPNVVTGNTNTSVSATLSGLNPGTTYHYRLSALNGLGSGNSPDATFTTNPNSVSDLQKGGFSLFPNPSNGQFTINSSKSQDIEIYVYDGLGRTIQVDITRDGNSYKVDMNNSTVGNYFIKIISDGSWYGKTISKQ